MDEAREQKMDRPFDARLPVELTDPIRMALTHLLDCVPESSGHVAARDEGLSCLKLIEEHTQRNVAAMAERPPKHTPKHTPGNYAPTQTKVVTDEMVNCFLSWPCDADNPSEARRMLESVLNVRE